MGGTQPEYDDYQFMYDENDDDINRHANKKLNSVNHLLIRDGRLDVEDFEREEKLRKYGQNIVMQKALLAQIEEKKRAREESERRRKFDEIRELGDWRKSHQSNWFNSKKKTTQLTNLAQSSTNHKELQKKSSMIIDESIEDKYKVEHEKKLHSRLKSEHLEMERERARMRSDLEEELRKEREFMRDLPNMIHQKIRETMNNEMDRIKIQMNDNTDRLRGKVQTLRQQAIELDTDKNLAVKEINTLRNN